MEQQVQHIAKNDVLGESLNVTCSSAYAGA
jgi:hypothetical protein